MQDAQVQISNCCSPLSPTIQSVLHCSFAKAADCVASARKVILLGQVAIIANNFVNNEQKRMQPYSMQLLYGPHLPSTVGQENSTLPGFHTRKLIPFSQHRLWFIRVRYRKEVGCAAPYIMFCSCTSVASCQRKLEIQNDQYLFLNPPPPQVNWILGIPYTYSSLALGRDKGVCLHSFSLLWCCSKRT